MVDTHTLLINSVLLLLIEWQKWGKSKRYYETEPLKGVVCGGSECQEHNNITGNTAFHKTTTLQKSFWKYRNEHRKE